MKIQKNFFVVSVVLVIVFAVSVGATYGILKLTGAKNLSLSSTIVRLNDRSFYESLPGKVPKAYVVQSGSMEPAIATGSIVFSVPSESYWIGDAITFSQKPGSGRMVTHRIMNRTFPNGLNNPPVYQTSGDANEDFDPGNVTHEQVVGKVSLVIPYLGYAADFAKKPYGFILLVIVPATIIVYEELKKIFSEIGKFLEAIFLKIKKKKHPENSFESDLSERGDSQDTTFKGTALQGENKGLDLLGNASFVVPVFGAFLVFTGLAASYFSDTELSRGNVFSASASFFSPSPALSVTPTPLVTPTPGVFASIYQSEAFTCADGATSTDGVILGAVTFEIESGNLITDVSVSGGTANSTYDIWINQDPGGCPLQSPSFAGAITTDGSGNGEANDLSVPLVENAEDFWVSAVGGGQVLRSTAVQLP